jgi:CelD/BcsL family acetyltransferase involved in cellulose biosynthesis
VFHYSDIAYDESHSALSPGKVLLYLLIDDLHRWNVPAVINFGVGEAGYKRHFGSRSLPYRSVMWAPSTLANRARVELHHAFAGIRRSAKRWLVQ